MEVEQIASPSRAPLIKQGSLSSLDSESGMSGFSSGAEETVQEMMKRNLVDEIQASGYANALVITASNGVNKSVTLGDPSELLNFMMHIVDEVRQLRKREVSDQVQFEEFRRERMELQGRLEVAMREVEELQCLRTQLQNTKRVENVDGVELQELKYKLGLALAELTQIKTTRSQVPQIVYTPTPVTPQEVKPASQPVINPVVSHPMNHSTIQHQPVHTAPMIHPISRLTTQQPVTRTITQVALPATLSPVRWGTRRPEPRTPPTRPSLARGQTAPAVVKRPPCAPCRLAGSQHPRTRLTATRPSPFRRVRG